MNVADESNKVADFRIKNTETRSWISLRIQRLGKITNRLKTDHRFEAIPARFASAGVDETAHFVRQEIRRLLVHKCNEAHRVFCSFASKTSHQSKERGGSTPVVVCARRTEH